MYFSFETEKSNFEVDKIIDKKTIETFTIDINDSEYHGLLRLMFSIDDDIDLDETLKALLKQIGHPMPTKKVSLIQT